MLKNINNSLSQLENSHCNANQSNWFTIEEAAEYSRFSIRQVRRWINEGMLKSKKIVGGRKLLIHKKWIDNFIMFGKSDRLTPQELKEISELENK